MSGSAGDRDNFSGDFHVNAATGGYTKGLIYLVQDAYCVARETKDAGVSCLMTPLCSGAIRVSKAVTTGQSLAPGDKVYVKSNKIANATSTGAVLLPCIAVETVAATDTTVLVAPGGIAPTAT